MNRSTSACPHDLEPGTPAVAVVDPLGVDVEGRGRIVVAVDPAARPTVGDLADAVGLGGRGPVVVDGRTVDRRAPLVAAGVVHGSRVTVVGRGPAFRVPTCSRPPSTRDDADGSPGPPDGDPLVTLTVEAGPDATTEIALSAGRHVVGRASSADVRVDDPGLELHHLIVDVDGSGYTTIIQLAGRVPVRDLAGGDGGAGGDACDGGGGVAPTGGPLVVLAAASRLRIGPRRDRADASATLASRAGDPWRRSLHRPPRSLAEWAPEPVAAPTTDPAPVHHAGGVIAAGCALGGGLLIALVTRNAMFVLFGAVGVVGAVGARLAAGWRRHKEQRDRRARSQHDIGRFRTALAEQRRQRAEYHASIAHTVGAAVRVATGPGAALWERRGEHHDAFTVTLGWGTVPWTAAVDAGARGPGDDDAVASLIAAAERFDDAPVVADLGHGAAIAVVGDGQARAVTRAVIVQLATFTGPADWRLVVVVDSPDRWAWTVWLPHLAAVVDAGDPGAVAAALARLDDGDERHTVVVTDGGDLLANRTGALRRYLDAARSVAVIALLGPGSTVPSMCRSALEVGSLCAARWRADTGSAATWTAVHVAGATEVAARDVARRLAAIHDPEDSRGSVGAMPTNVGLGALLRRSAQVDLDDPIALAARWRRSDGSPRAAIGMTGDGVVEIDLVRDGPHALLAGTTGAGKSELLRTLVVSLAAGSSPDDLTFVLIDYKGGSAFDACAELPHTVGVVTDLDEHLAARALASLDAEIRRRERVLRSAGAEDHVAYRALVGVDGAPPLPRVVVVVDEFAALAADVPGFVDALVGVAQRGRSLGVHLVLATQRPGGVVSDDIRANTNLRLALRLHDRADAVDVVGVAAPTEFPRGAPGRALLRLGPDETIVFQAACSSGEHRRAAAGAVAVAVVDRSRPGGDATDRRGHTSELVVLARSIRAAASLCDVERPFRPWLEPLPSRIDADTLATLLPDVAPCDLDDVVGVVDDPRAQRRVPLRWDPAAANLALVGSFGAGTTTALRAVLAARRAGTFVLDARGDGGLGELATMAWCAAVVGRHEAERRSRAIRHLAAEVERRQAAPSRDAPHLVLAIDGLAGILDAVSGAGDVDEHAALMRVLTDGLAVGVSTVATLERASGVPLSAVAAFGRRWVFHLDDPNDAGPFGLGAGLVPPAVPGRMVDAATRWEAQIAIVERRAAATGSAPPGDVVSDPSARAVPSIGTLPAVVDAASLPASSATEAVVSLVVGVDFGTLGAAVLDVPTGEHVLVVGPARSGRSNALLTLAQAWRQANPRGSLVVRCPRPSSLSAWAESLAGADSRVVIAADDAGLAACAGDTGDGTWAFVVDDAERVDDPGQALAALAGERRRDVMLLAAGRPEALRASYGSWTSVVRRSRVGVMMASGVETDGELFGEYLPRRLPIPARPGLAWLLDGDGRRLAQIAVPASPGPVAVVSVSRRKPPTR